MTVLNENDPRRGDVGIVVAHESRDFELVGALPDGEDVPSRGELVDVLDRIGG